MVKTNRRWGAISMWMIVASAMIGSLGAGLYWRRYVQSPRDDAGPYQQFSLPEGVIATDIAVDLPGTENPQFADDDDRRIFKSLSVIGLIVDEEAYAYSIDALSIPTNSTSVRDLSELARRHVVNQLLAETAISVTYCDISKCVRVFRRDDQSQVLPLGISGLSNGRMVLRFDGRQYLQDSPEIPLDDFYYEIATWGEWVLRHPTSKIYLGG